ncbi:hypothetical protein [Nocardia barduliensis]|uniref:hypothetical protein n=1 Tax=Nocardia barduliensis TaxID=2736643 RepID=UPI001571777B|nr:hypothetical protein [Nocardia barduliensis]
MHAPISAGTLTKKLNAHGIAVRAERNSAMLALACDLPGPILAARHWSHYLHAHNEQATTATPG